MVEILEENSRIFYHVYGDSYEYFNLDRLLHSHPEEKGFVHRHRFELEREYLQKRERSL